MVTEQPAQLPHSLTGLAPHLPDPGGQRGVGADVAWALTTFHRHCHTDDDENVHLNVGSLGREAAQHPVLAHQLGYELLIAQAILEGNEYSAL